MGIGPTALAAVAAECAKTTLGTFALGCQAPDDGNMHTLLHFGTAEQKEKYRTDGDRGPPPLNP